MARSRRSVVRRIGDSVQNAAAGIAAVMVLRQFWRVAQLTEVKITVPQVSELKFIVNGPLVAGPGEAADRHAQNGMIWVRSSA
jgi:hypothetical protein